MKRRSLLMAPAALAAAVPVFAQSRTPRTTESQAGTATGNESFPAFDLRHYGADPSGAAASDEALAAALRACGSGGGRIRLPAGSYSFLRPINLSGMRSIIIEGDAGTTAGAQAATRLIYQGSGDGVFLSLNSAVGCQLRGLQISHSSPQFRGTYVKCSNTGSNDPAFCGLFDCVLGSAANPTVTHVDLDKCIEFTAERCNFIAGNPSVRGRSSGAYSNAIRFRDCQWADSRAVPVLNGGQSWTFEGCAFEGLHSGAAGALYCADGSTAFNGLVITGCWFGDANAAGTWIDICGNGVFIAGNYFSGNARGPAAISLKKSVGVQVTGNLFDQLLVGLDFAQAPCQDIVIQGNIASAVGSGFRNTENIPTGSFVWAPNYGFGEPGRAHQRLATTGYVADAAAGVLRQWGTTPVPGGGSHRVEFPIKFPAECLNVVATLAGGSASIVSVSALTASSFDASVQGGSSGAVLSWQALGR
ncbi:MAG: right-handed parallel beta-helix repeat-containing protein [Proteobacteria bacterium]|nr:right-handed parallel beta-helix repeat-containing protein [Pseudomonadota bacterium]